MKQEKGEIVYDPGSLFKVDEYGFFIYWKSEGKVRESANAIWIYK